MPEPDPDDLMASLKKSSLTPFQRAKAFKLTFGKYQGRALDDVACSDAGLRYLDWLRGETQDTTLLSMLNTYLDEPSIAQDLTNALDEDI
jgi:uncharacterized protein (DUF3820 family)